MVPRGGIEPPTRGFSVPDDQMAKPPCTKEKVFCYCTIASLMHQRNEGQLPRGKATLIVTLAARSNRERNRR